jgi:hypothetical protein
MSEKGSHIATGNISGTGIAIGDHAQAIVTITEHQSKELEGLLAQLRDEIRKAEIPESTKTVIMNKALPEMEKGARVGEVKSGLERGLERINDQLEGAGAAAKNVSGIIETVSKIASVVGIAIKTVAPFLAGLL